MEGEFYDPVFKAALDKDQALHHSLHMAENDDVLDLFWHHDEMVKGLLASGRVIRHHPSGNADIVSKRLVKVGDVITHNGKLCIVTNIEEREVVVFEPYPSDRSMPVKATKTTEPDFECVQIGEQLTAAILRLRSLNKGL